MSESVGVYQDGEIHVVVVSSSVLFIELSINLFI